MAAMVVYHEVEALVRKVKGHGMLNKVLQQICAAENQSQRGVKAELQSRIIDMIRLYAQSHDTTSYNRLKFMIENPNTLSRQGSPFNDRMSSPHTTNTGVTASNTGGYNAVAQPPRSSYGLDNLNLFKPSPFYTVRQQLGQTKTLEVMANHRHSVTIPIKVNDYPNLAAVNSDPSLRVMVFCGSESRGPQDVAFPHQSEVKVNGGEVKANLRGLKNKPGSTRPVDITKELRLKVPHYTNNVELTYALTSKKFYLLIFLVKTVPVQDLVNKLEAGQRITKESVLKDMANKARDADIVATASVLSLKCPLSTLRIDLPCRSVSCRHNQCFDATSYLQLQEQGPTWLCPICNNSAPFHSLAVDEYVKDILKSTSKSVDQVTVQPNGKWDQFGKPEPISKSNGIASSDDDDDDLVEITKTGHSIQMSTPRTNGTPTAAAIPPGIREASIASSGPRNPTSTSAKRPAPVIDLTSSGDEDDAPFYRQPKRQFHNNSANGFSNAPAYRPSNMNGFPPRT